MFSRPITQTSPTTHFVKQITLRQKLPIAPNLSTRIPRQNTCPTHVTGSIDTSPPEFSTYSGVVDHLREQGRKVGPEMRAYYDAYFKSLEHSPCYAEVVREPPNGYEHFPPLDRYEVSRMSTFVTFHKQGGGFEALSFDEDADYGGASFHDVGGTDIHCISDLPTPRVGRNE